MSQQLKGKEIPLEQLLELVEKAAGTIERLQSENAALTKRLQERIAAEQQAKEEILARDEQIRALDASNAEWQKDAEWFRWFRNKYGDSTFFSHIEREYLGAHPPHYESSQADAAADFVDAPAETTHAP